YGRGAYDMKAGLAASMIAARDAAGMGLRGDVIVTAVADEEVASIGTESVLRTWTADAAVVTEPTALEVCVAHKGFVAFEGETVGQAEAEVRGLLERRARDDPQFLGASRTVFSREGFEIGADEPIVELVRRHAGTTIAGASFWADSGLLGAAGIPTVLFGPG